MDTIDIGIKINLASLLKTRLLIQANSGGFNNALGRLRSLELIVGRGTISASKILCVED